MAGAEILPWGRGVGEGGCIVTAELRTPRPGWFFHLQNGHIERATPIGCLFSAPHNLGHTDPASDRPPATLPFEGPERACLPLGLFPKSLDLTLTSACPASWESGPALLDLLRPDVAHLPLVTSW